MGLLNFLKIGTPIFGTPYLLGLLYNYVNYQQRIYNILMEAEIPRDTRKISLSNPKELLAKLRKRPPTTKHKSLPLSPEELAKKKEQQADDSTISGKTTIFP